LTQSTLERHFFQNAEELFDIKHDIFTDDYLGSCLMGGDGLNYTPIDEIVFIHNKDQNSLYCSRILNAIINSQPLITVQNQSIQSSVTVFDIYYINNYEDIEDFYCLKSVYDFLVEGVMIYQIFEVKVKSLDMINDFWITRE